MGTQFKIRSSYVGVYQVQQHKILLTLVLMGFIEAYVLHHAN
jgi:hypothetical protein